MACLVDALVGLATGGRIRSETGADFGWRLRSVCRHLSKTAAKNSFGKPFWARSRSEFANCFIAMVCAPTLKRSLAAVELLAFRKMSVSNVFGKHDQASLTQLLKRLHLLVDRPYVVFESMMNTTYR